MNELTTNYQGFLVTLAFQGNSEKQPLFVGVYISFPLFLKKLSTVYKGNSSKISTDVPMKSETLMQNLDFQTFRGFMDEMGE